MKRIASPIVVVSLFVSVSCHRPNEKAVQPATRLETAPAEEEAIHTGTVELVKKAELEGIKTIALASGVKSLLVSDGTIIGEQAIDLEILSLSELDRTASFTITDAMSAGYPWSSNSLAVDRDGFHALLYNQYIELIPPRAKTVLDIQQVIGRANVWPEPWSISPNGKLALVCVGSYWSHDESTLATFDLTNGKSVKRLATGRFIEYGCACFLDDATVASIDCDGVVTIHHLGDSTTTVLPQKLTQGAIQEGRNLRLHPFDGGEKIVVTGDDEISVLHVTQQTVLFRYSRTNGNAITTSDGRLLLWQNDRLKKPTYPKAHVGEIQHMLFVADIQTGKIVAEYSLPTFYHMMVIDDAAEYIYAAQYSKLHKLKIDLSPIGNNQRVGAEQTDEREPE